MTAQGQTSLNVNVCSMYVYIMIMDTIRAHVYSIHDHGLYMYNCLSCCGEHFLSVGVDLWDQLMSPPSWMKPLHWQGSCPVPYSFLGKDSVEAALWRVGLAGLQREETLP